MFCGYMTKHKFVLPLNGLKDRLLDISNYHNHIHHSLFQVFGVNHLDPHLLIIPMKVISIVSNFNVPFL